MNQQSHSPTVEEALQAVQTGRRRQALRYLAGNGDGPVEVATLADALRNSADSTTVPPSREKERLEVTLHHVDLPKLDEMGLLEYDRQHRTVSYHGIDSVEELLTFIADTFE
ncbi:hypothetical protein NDI85_19535 [Halomicroarcula sp. S1AR25-4]|uniref:DUF7344 domain-containing protein n=1 Tax=Haloarcula sp. S1AR25-4 TaxID=2950538 RepID=UPI002874879D|nr:hypothetical protein [Halomicroarcula sp. S1AR25-4]MDS0279980.1 hypothetical protein [Halomicroarcula sp. S1AR25-4]